jgi:UDPglucose 6-dehydrogenase
MRLTIVGTGYVGLITGACFADTGNDVIGYDTDPEKVDICSRGESPIFEPGLPELLKSNIQARRLRFTTDTAEAVRHAEVIMIAVGTPPRADGSSDLTAIRAVADDIADHLDNDKIVVIKSTVPVGTGDELEARVNARSKHKVAFVSTPEFLKEGSAVEDFQKPDRIVIGAEDPAAAEIIRELHEPLVRNQRPILVMRRRAAEMTKYASNTFLATKISFINQIAMICEMLGIDVNEVRRGMGTDARIGFQFLHPGMGYGGSCFPKDVQALAHFAGQAGAQADLIECVHEVNRRQRQVVFDKILNRFGSELKNKCLALWGISFKPRTDDIREAPAVTVIEKLLEAGAAVRAHDPEALDNLRAQFGERVTYCEWPYETLDGADALAICTEWNEFRSPNFDEMKSRLREPIIFDGRNLYEPKSMIRRGFEYYPVGRPAVGPDELKETPA